MSSRSRLAFATFLHLVHSASAIESIVRKVHASPNASPNVAIEVAANSRIVMVRGGQHHEHSEYDEKGSDDHHGDIDGEGGLSDVEMIEKIEATAKAGEKTRLAGLAARDQGKWGGHSGQSDGDFRVMYGVVTTYKQKYRDKLEAAMDTWASKPMANGLFLAVGGKAYPQKWQVPDRVMAAADCGDGIRGNSCREATLVVEAAKRNATWLFIVGEDNYVDTELVEASLRREASDVPVGLGCIGCGKHKERYGALVAKKGGFCGGCGEALSRASLQSLTAGGGAALLQEYGDETQCDMSTSRALRDRGIALTDFPGILFGNVVFEIKSLANMVGKTATFHYMTPPLMRWVHAKRIGANDADMQALEEEAFEHGCVRGLLNPIWHSRREKCLRRSKLGRKHVHNKDT